MKKKVLIVDDEPDVAYVIREGFEDISAGYEIMDVTSGRECLDLLENGQIPDIILLDIMMPEMDGWDVFAKLKENPSWEKIPVVFLTAKTDSYSKGFGRIVAQDYIEKPFEIEDLKKRIDKVINRLEK